MKRILSLSAALLFVLAGGARADGTIITTGATLTVGAGSPQGAITNEPGLPAGPAPAIPAVGTLGSIGTFSSQMPAFPGGGSGADGAFAGAADTSNAGGTFDYSSYQVNPGVTVTYTSGATIRVTGNVTIAGTVRTTGANTSITFQCAGAVSIGQTGKVLTQSATSSILIDADLNVTSLTATLKGGGRDTLSLSLGFVTPGAAPASFDPGMTISFGGTFTLAIPAATFGAKKRETYSFKGNYGGLTNVAVDYAKGIVTIKGKNLDLGAFATGANSVTIRCDFAGATRTLVIGVVKTGTKLSY